MAHPKSNRRLQHLEYAAPALRAQGVFAESQVLNAFNWANGRRPTWFLGLRHGNTFEDGVLKADYFAVISVPVGIKMEQRQIPIQVKRSEVAGAEFRRSHPSVHVLVVPDRTAKRLDALWSDLFSLVVRERDKILRDNCVRDAAE